MSSRKVVVTTRGSFPRARASRRPQHRVVVAVDSAGDVICIVLRIFAFTSSLYFYSVSAMDYLRTLGSAAVSSLVQKSGLTLPFSLGPKVTSFENRTIWSLYDGTKRVRSCSLNHGPPRDSYVVLLLG